MDFIGKPLSGDMLINMHSRCLDNCSRVLAAIAYADNTKIFEQCDRKSIPVEFFGRYDGSCAIAPRVLRWFLDQRNPSLVCKMVPKYLHAKIIWWQDEGVYIGSANLTDRAWNRNYEAGIFFSDAEMRHLGIDEDLDLFFEGLRKRAQMLTEEMYKSQLALFEKRARVSRDLDNLERQFDETDHWVQNAQNPVEVDEKTSDERRYATFKKEWNATLEYMRLVAARVSDPAVRPAWIGADVPSGVQADQFLHAYYYRRVKDGPRHPFQEAHERHKGDPEGTLKSLLAWWRQSDFDFTHEQRTINEWAKLIQESFAARRILTLSESEWVAAASCVHAIRDHAAKVDNQLLGLPPSPQLLETKIAAFCHWLWHERSQSGRSCLELVNFVVWGHGEVTERLWEGVHNPAWKLRHVATSILGEIVGWANPSVYPPRNMRTSKSLRALGFDVNVSL